MKRAAALICFVLLASISLGCKDDHNHDHSGHKHSKVKKHAHSAPHGGVLVELEDHVANVEFTFDGKTGTLGMYCLGGHAHKALIPESKALEVEIKAGAETISIKLSGVANSLTGETKDKTSQFQGADPKLKSLKEFTGTLKMVKVKGKEYKNVAFSFPNK